MKPDRAPGSAPRIAIVGSTSPIGKELRLVLENASGPWPLLMLDTDEYAGLLQEFGGEIEIVQVISPERLEEVDIAVFTCAPRFLEEYLSSGAYLPPLTVDLTGGKRSGAVYVDGVSSDTNPAGRGPLIAPRAETVVIARILERLHRAVRVVACEATVLESTSEHGGAAMAALQEETAKVLNFEQREEKAHQRAFNLIGPDRASDRRAARIARQIGSICTDGCPAPAVQLVSVPLFQGAAISMHVRLERDLAVEEIEDLLTRESLTLKSDPPRTPLEILGSSDVHLSRVAEGADANAFWIWIVADNLRLAAVNALRLIEQSALTPR